MSPSAAVDFKSERKWASTMKVKEIMTPFVELVAPDATVQLAAEMMKEWDIGALLVCDHDQIVGIVTDRDIAVRAAAQGYDPTVTSMQAVLTPQVVSCFDDQDIGEAAEIMQEKQIRRLAVLNRDHHLVGILTLGDLALRQEDAEAHGDNAGIRFYMHFVKLCLAEPEA